MNNLETVKFISANLDKIYSEISKKKKIETKSREKGKKNLDKTWSTAHNALLDSNKI